LLYPQHKLFVHPPNVNAKISEDAGEESPSKKRRTVRFSEATADLASRSPALTEDLIQWTTSALETLNRIRWTETGREKVLERTSEGSSVEMSRPVFAISNPNDLIEELLSSYGRLLDLHPGLPVCPIPITARDDMSSGPDLEKSYGPLSHSPTFNFSLADSGDATDFANLPPLDDATYPENSLSWGLVDSWTGAG
jgi:hypothetical protein